MGFRSNIVSASARILVIHSAATDPFPSLGQQLLPAPDLDGW